MEEMLRNIIESSMLAWVVLILNSSGFAQRLVNAQLPWHDAVLDSQGRLLAWYHPETGSGYDHVVRLAWDFIEHKVPNDTRTKTGQKIYLINAVFDPHTLQGANWQGNPASTFGQFVDSLAAWYPYSGDRAAIEVVRTMLDYQLAHGTTPANWNWASVPFSTNCDDNPQYGGCLQDTPPGYAGGIETDKVGELGVGYNLFYELTGDRKYLDAGIHCADALAAHVRTGDADHTPWPFRLDARTGDVLQATTAEAEQPGGKVNGNEYGGMVVAPIRLFDELIRIREGNVTAYQKALQQAWNWIKAYPMNPSSKDYGKWSQYFEDVSNDVDNVNQASPTMTAYYLLTRPEPSKVDPDWTGDVGRLIDWVRLTLGRGPYLGAWAIDEQGTRIGGAGHVPEGQGCCSRAGLASDTSRWGAINAMYFDATGDAQAYEDAFRSLNYATYFADSNGLIACCGTEFGIDVSYWFDDGYGDYIRNFMWAMAAIPQFAPTHESHLLASSSVVQQVTYGPNSISWRTFDAVATDTLRLRFAPTVILAGGTTLRRVPRLNSSDGYSIEPLGDGDYVVRIRHTRAREVNVH